MSAELLEDPMKRKQEIRRLVQKNPKVRAAFDAVADSEGCPIGDLNVAQGNKALEIAVLALTEDHRNIKEEFADHIQNIPYPVHERGSI